MKSQNSLLVVCISAIVITLLFYKQGIGLNVFFLDLAFVVYLFVRNELDLTKKMVLLTVAGMLITSIFTVINYSIYTYVVHFVALFLFVGVLNFATARSLLTSTAIASASFFMAQGVFWKGVFGAKFRGSHLGAALWKTRIFVVPFLIIVFFISIYSFSSQKFAGLVSDISDVLERTFQFLFQDISFAFIATFVLALIISSFLWLRTSSKKLEQTDRRAGFFLMRNRPRTRFSFKTLALKNEYKAGVFLLVVLNILILVLNGLDIYWVWFNFEWTGQTLKSYVHEGTYFLIFSILISIAVVLYFFRGNINFYKQNGFLKTLSYIWLAQNGILALSVAIRNYRYIEHYALAYKRIGVIVFLLLTVYGLYTVVRKIQYKKSNYFLFTTNAFALYFALIVTSLINWDKVIASYNFTHADTSYVHLDYLVDFSDKALPYLTFSEEKLTAMESYQLQHFTPAHGELTYAQYQKIVARRTEAFKKKWENKNLLAWNWAEFKAYQSLTSD